VEKDTTMATSEERMKILDMIREGKLKAEEGARLLQALQAGSKKAADKRDSRWLRVRVTDLKSGKAKVNVNLPMSLVNVGIKMGARFIPKDANFDAEGVMEAIKAGTTGKIVDMEDTGDGERIEIWVE
jgi:hypothetical protein